MRSSVIREICSAALGNKRRIGPADNADPSSHDTDLFDRLLGATLGQLVKFEGPTALSEGGAGWAVRMMREARLNRPEPIYGNLHRAYALLDGEQRLKSHAKYCFLLQHNDLLSGDRIIHAQPRDVSYNENNQVDRYGNTDGFLFLNAHEQESLYYIYGGVWNQLKNSWKGTRNLFGENIGVNDLWKIIARAAAYTLLTSVIKRYDLNANDVIDASNLLKQTHHKTIDLVEAALKPLRNNMINRGIPNRVIKREFAEIRHAIKIMDERIDQYPSIRYRMLRFCDPKAWLAIANISQKVDWRRARIEVLESPLSGRFQADLIQVLLGDPQLNQAGSELTIGEGPIRLSTRLPRM